MPLTAKGAEILGNMEQEYGAKKGEQVFYASRNAGKIGGVDSVAARIDAIVAGCDALARRLDAAERKDAGDEPGNGKEPYGDVPYADPGYQPDGKKRYPISTAEKIRSAWDYLHKAKDADRYTADQRRQIAGRIVAAWKRKIDPKGPPEATQ